jgi:membrane-associated phospholipid phosphatase
MHMLGQGGLAGFVFFTAMYAQTNMQGYFLLSIIGAGLVGTSRIILKAHTLPEVYTGFVIGFFSQFVAFVVFPWLGIFS